MVHNIFNSSGNVETCNGLQKIVESMISILATPKGSRFMMPTFGSEIHKCLFHGINDATFSLLNFYATKALQEWEPRIEVLNVESKQNTSNPLVLDLSISFKIKSTSDKYNYVFPINTNVHETI